jgi:hypothetical protein
MSPGGGRRYEQTQRRPAYRQSLESAFLTLMDGAQSTSPRTLRVQLPQACDLNIHSHECDLAVKSRKIMTWYECELQRQAGEPMPQWRIDMTYTFDDL